MRLDAGTADVDQPSCSSRALGHDDLSSHVEFFNQELDRIRQIGLSAAYTACSINDHVRLDPRDIGFCIFPVEKMVVTPVAEQRRQLLDASTSLRCLSKNSDN